MRHLHYVGSAEKDLLKLPKEVRHTFYHGLLMAQAGSRHPDAKTLSGMGSAKVVEIRKRFLKGAYRVVYTVEFEEAVYVLHAFQKKSSTGIATPKKEMDVVRKRLKSALADYRERYKEK